MFMIFETLSCKINDEHDSLIIVSLRRELDRARLTRIFESTYTPLNTYVRAFLICL